MHCFNKFRFSALSFLFFTSCLIMPLLSEGSAGQQFNIGTEQNCTSCANAEFAIVRYFLGDAVGNILPATCSSGDTIAAFLWLEVNQTTTRYSLVVEYSFDITSPSGGFSTGGDSTCLYVNQAIPLNLIQLAAIDYICGDVLETSQMKLSWQANAIAACAFDTLNCRCDANPRKVDVPFSFMISLVDETCPGSGTGSATAIATGGKNPYTYNWSNGDSVQTAFGLSSGNYSLTVTDSAGTMITQNFVIAASSDTVKTAITSTNITCFGGSNGTATVVVSGGTAPYTYAWSNGQTSDMATGLSAGTYYITATDTNGCAVLDSVLIIEPMALQLNTQVLHPSCPAASDGVASVITMGGTPPYQYLWSTTPAQTNASASGLPAGWHSVVVTDANNCSATTAVQLTDPPIGTPCATVIDSNMAPYTQLYINANGFANMALNTAHYNQVTDSVFFTRSQFLCADANDTIPVTLTITNTSVTPALTYYSNNTFVVVFDTLKPALEITSQFTLFLNGNGESQINYSQVNIASTDNCAIDTSSAIFLPKNSFTCNDIGSHNMQLTVADASGNLSNASFLLHIIDSISPDIFNLTDTLYLENGSLVVQFEDIATAADNCTLDSTLINQATSVTFTCQALGQQVVTLTAIDSSGNNLSTSANIYILDTTTFTYQTNIDTVYLANGSATAAFSNMVLVQTTGCQVPVLQALSDTVFGCPAAKQNPNYITFEISDGIQTVFDSVAVFVLDTIAPQLLLKSDTLFLVNNSTTLTFANINNGSFDNCGIDQVLLNGQTSITFTCANVGLNTIVVSIQDSSGNISTGSTTIYVANTATTTYVKTPYHAYLQGNNVAVSRSNILNNLFWGCNSSASLTFISDTVFSCADILSNPNYITFQFTDGNTTVIDSVAVTVLDTAKPDINPKVITVLALNTSGFRNLSPLDVLLSLPSDNCGIDTIIISPTQITCANTANYLPVSVSVMDIYGNTSHASVLVLAQDITQPVVVTQGATLVLDSLSGTATLSAGQVVVSSNDACGIGSTILGKTNFTCADIGNNNVLLTVTDTKGNQNVASVPVLVHDQTAPYFNVVAQHTLYLNASGQAQLSLANILVGSVFEACGVFIPTFTKSFFDCTDAGANTVSVTITDASGNALTKSLIIQVLDTIAPVLTTKTHSTFIDANTGMVTISPSDVIQNAIDNCGLNAAATLIVPSTFTCSNLGTQTVQVTIFDMNGNSTTQTTQVVILDNPPVNLGIDGPIEVCSNQYNVLYKPTNLDTSLTYQWQVTGGQVVSTAYRGHEIYIQWKASDTGALQVTTLNSSTCNPSMGLLNVAINGQSPSASTIDFWGNATQNTLVIDDAVSKKFQWGYDVFQDNQRISTTLPGQISNSYYNTQIVSNINNLGYIYWCDASFDGTCWQRSYYGNAFPIQVDEYNGLNIVVYPNPFASEIKIEAPIAEKLFLYDPQGQLVGVNTFAMGEIIILRDVDNLPAGFYIIQIIHTNGAVTHHKILKSK